MTQLSEHFTLEELSHSDTAVRLGVDNTPPAEIVPHMVVAAHGMELIRKVLCHPVTVHIGFRCEALERIICAKAYAAWCDRHGKDVATAWDEYMQIKEHPRGYAVDFTCWAFGAPPEIVKVVRAAGIKFDMLCEEGTWVHACFDPLARGQVLVARFDKDGKPSYTKEA